MGLLDIILRVLRLDVTMFTLQASFKPLLLKRGGGSKNPLVEVTVNSKEDFCPNYVQEFGLGTADGATYGTPFPHPD